MKKNYKFLVTVPEGSDEYWDMIASDDEVLKTVYDAITFDFDDAIVEIYKEPLDEKLEIKLAEYREVAWRQAALQLGMEITDVLPTNYYELGPLEFIVWALKEIKKEK